MFVYYLQVWLSVFVGKSLVNGISEMVFFLRGARVFENSAKSSREKETYEPIDLNKTYTIAASNYFLLDCGSGMKMFESARIIQDDGILDVEAVEQYIVEKLNGVVGQQYQEVTPNITFTEGELSASENVSPVWWIVGIGGGFAILLLVVLILKGEKET